MPNLHPNGIFGHGFKVDGQDMYYDVNTNQILEIDPELASVLLFFGTISQGDLLQKLQATWPKTKIYEACEIIKCAQKEEDLFLTKRPHLVPPAKKLSEPGECDTNLRHLVLTVTEQCNMRCRYCVHGADLGWVRGHGKRAMSLQTAQKSLQYFLGRVEEDTIPMVSFYGGESLLELDTIEKVIEEGRKHPRGKDAMFIIDTNGLLLSEKAIDLVAREKVYLQISIDGPAFLHDRNRVDSKGQGTLNRILSNLDNLVMRDPTAAERLSFIATLTPPVDLFELAGFFAEFPPFIKHGIKEQPRLRVNFANLKGQYWPASKQEVKALSLQVEQARVDYLTAVENGTRADLSPVIRELFDPEIIKIHHRSRAMLGDRYTPGGSCRPGRRKVHVTVDGKFQPCERTGKVMEFGDMEKGIEAGKVRKIQEKFHAAIVDKCGNCWALRLCGVCLTAQAENGVDGSVGDMVSEEICERVRRNQEIYLKMLGGILRMGEDGKGFLEEWVVV